MTDRRAPQQMRGFTLLELMVVVAIIGVLATIALPNYQTYIQRSQMVEALALVGDLKHAVKEYFQNELAFPHDNAAAGLPPPDKLLGNYVQGIALVDGAFHVSLGQRIAEPLRHQVISVRPIVVTDSPLSPMSWICGYAPAPSGMHAVGSNQTNVDPILLPHVCR